MFGGLPLLLQLAKKLLKGDWGADLLAGIAIVTALLLDELLAASLVILMLSGGALLESYATRKASSVLEALAKRMPSVAHAKTDAGLCDIATDRIKIGDILVVLPHEICPVDGIVTEGAGTMDESYLTGEPYLMDKISGSSVLSGAINGDSALTIQAGRQASDSRYAKIMQVMQASSQQRPQLRRLGDRLGALYAPVAVAVAALAWLVSHDPVRFLAVLVIATPCPLLIGIPVAIIGSISLAAKRDIIIKNPAILETLSDCRTAIFDKTGTLTYGRPSLTAVISSGAFQEHEVLGWAASLERYSKHPMATAIVRAHEKTGRAFQPVSQLAEQAGNGITGVIAGKTIQIGGRNTLSQNNPDLSNQLPQLAGGLECIILVDGNYAATLRFHDEIRRDSSSFINHLNPKHLFNKIMLVSGDRESEVRYLAELTGIQHVYYQQSPEQKLQLVQQETKAAKTLFLGDGINDAPALTAATIGIAFGNNSDITGESADAVIMESSLQKVDELIHIGHRMRTIALQSAIGGIALSLVGMAAAAYGLITPVGGAIMQEIIDLLAVLNALRAAFPPKQLSDY
ncbi:MAG: heavy metal translocating P-type ATPase [Methylobacter sp.]|nr:MAG: heavy metal translocating P-type ATPase [Methylobacter sp.]